MCIFPTIRRNPKYKITKKNGGKIPAVSDKRALWTPTGCGKCIECRKQKTREWQVRISEDIKTNKNGKFVTLTISTESIKELERYEEVKNAKGYEKDNRLVTRAVRLFTERWRKKYKKAPRHWLISELGNGEWEHVHLHGIIWEDDIEEIKKKWKYGHVVIRKYVNETTATYAVKYMKKTDIKHKEYKPKMLTSAGIGENYIHTHNARINKYKTNGETNEMYTNRAGYKMPIPMYWRNKIYTDEEREKLWMEKLDKDERYVMGIKIEEASKNEETYYNIIREARKKNEKLGYGDDTKNWDRVKYENDKRTKLYKKRLKE